MESQGYFGLVKLQKGLVWLIAVAFVVSVAVYLINSRIGMKFYQVSLILLILSAPIRFIWMSSHFRQNGDTKYQWLAWVVILIIGVSALMKLWH
ncbi:membrane hypothetical protein [Candidatus Zixiibacteriota bacterium]|nr:membrane hypothetical protein [candidate division Zixibacteria bacterium]